MKKVNSWLTPIRLLMANYASLCTYLGCHFLRPRSSSNEDCSGLLPDPTRPGAVCFWMTLRTAYRRNTWLLTPSAISLPASMTFVGGVIAKYGATGLAVTSNRSLFYPASAHMEFPGDVHLLLPSTRGLTLLHHELLST